MLSFSLSLLYVCEVWLYASHVPAAKASSVRHLELPTCGLATLDDDGRNCTPAARRQDSNLDVTHLPHTSCKLCSLVLHREVVKVDRRVGMLERCEPDKNFMILNVPFHHSWLPSGGSVGQERRITMLVVEHIQWLWSAAAGVGFLLSCMTCPLGGPGGCGASSNLCDLSFASRFP
jgi:hypothetical protein